MGGDGDQAARLFASINPINHALTPDEVARYKVEPYAAVADVYSQPPHAGSGGWSWYIGSAGWMQRVGVESILGVCIRNGRILLSPCIPKDWPKYEVTFVWQSARYVTTVRNPAGVNRGVVSVTVDGEAAPEDQAIVMVNDGAAHAVLVVLG